MPKDPDFVYGEEAEEEIIEDDNHSGSGEVVHVSTDDTPSKSWKVLTVEGEIEENRPKSGRKKRSALWKHFVKAANGKSATCSYCQQVLSFAGSLSNLLRHLRKKHPSIAASIQLTSHSNIAVFDRSDSIQYEVDETGHERLSADQIRLIKSEHDLAQSCAKKLKTADIEFVLKRDHSYIEQPQNAESLFATFIQSEINKFNSEYIKRKCKREILQVLMKHQQDEDDLYNDKAAADQEN